MAGIVAAASLLAFVLLLSGSAPPGVNAGHIPNATPDANEPDTDDPGFRVTVPGLTRERPAPLVEHKLEAGMIPSQVATLYDMSAGLLLELNGIDDPRDIPAGTKLVVARPPAPPVLLPCGDLLAPVDKQRALPADCEPDELVTLPVEHSYGGTQLLIPQAADALISMLEAAEEAGHLLYVRSSYRDYAEQAATFQFWVDQLGYEQAVRLSAQAGHSEHQMGTTADVTNAAVNFGFDQAFADTAGGRWLADHVTDFGFVISYEEGREEETGFSFEPWHIRYVGPETAADFEASGLTLNQYLAREWLPGRHRLGLPLE